MGVSQWDRSADQRQRALVSSSFSLHPSPPFPLHGCCLCPRSIASVGYFSVGRPSLPFALRVRVRASEEERAGGAPVISRSRSMQRSNSRTTALFDRPRVCRSGHSRTRPLVSRARVGGVLAARASSHSAAVCADRRWRPLSWLCHSHPSCSRSLCCIALSCHCDE